MASLDGVYVHSSKTPHKNSVSMILRALYSQVQLVDEDVIGLANDLLWYLVSNNPVYSWHPSMVFMSTQVKHRTSLYHIVSQNKIKTMGNLAKLHERTVQT